MMSKVTEQMAWCAGMVTVPKRLGDVCTYMCWFESTQWECYERDSSHIKGGQHPCTVIYIWSASVLKIGCKEWILANPTGGGILVDNIHHALRQVHLQ